LIRAAIGIAPRVGIAFDELIDQIAVGRMNLDVIEVSGFRIPCSPFILSDQVTEFPQKSGPADDERNQFAFATLVFDKGLAFRDYRRRRNRKHVVRLQRRMRDAPDMPELIEDQSFGLVHRLGDLPPGFHCSRLWMPGVQA
jgi:hypothetical protein